MWSNSNGQRIHEEMSKTLIEDPEISWKFDSSEKREIQPEMSSWDSHRGLAQHFQIKRSKK
jgi:hypothetical protein